MCIARRLVDSVTAAGKTVRIDAGYRYEGCFRVRLGTGLLDGMS